MSSINIAPKTEKYEDNWPVFEKLLAYLRYLKIRKWITKSSSAHKNICVDIGCGFDGRFLRSISSKIEQGYGIDIRANENVYENIKIINNSNVNGAIPINSNSVDRVFMLAVIEHLDTDNNLVKEGARVLCIGGLFILTTPTPFAKAILEFLSFKLHLISVESIQEHKHYYNKHELTSIFKSCGLEIIKYNKFQLGCNQLIIGRKI